MSKGRSMGTKLIVVCGLAVLTTIPALFVDGLVQDRTKRAGEVVEEISGHAGGRQTFLGPTLAIPYSIPSASPKDSARRGTYLVFGERASAVVQTTTVERHRSLFRVPVYEADLKLEATFDLNGVPAEAPPGAQMDWSRAEIVVGVSDPRGALADGTMAIGGKTMVLVPAEVATEVAVGGGKNPRSRLTLFGTNAAAVAGPGAQFTTTAVLKFSGAQRIAALAYGKATHFTMRGDWPNPGFDGSFPPISRTVTGKGFEAEWAVPFIARGIRAEGRMDSFAGLEATALGVSFIEMADPYQSVDRALKYLLLFVGLLFLSYFIFEVTTGKRVHPAQYVLVGVAQIIFYLLLLSLAERIGFDAGFLLAGAATVGLLSINTTWVFASRLQGIRALLIFGLLYVLIYLLLRLEDNALLVGAVASFVAVTAAMYFTRGIDWYSSLPARNDPMEGHL